MISFGVTVREVTEKFVAEGNSPEASYLAAVAGKLFSQKINSDIATPSNG